MKNFMLRTRTLMLQTQTLRTQSRSLTQLLRIWSWSWTWKGWTWLQHCLWIRLIKFWALMFAWWEMGQIDVLKLWILMIVQQACIKYNLSKQISILLTHILYKRFNHLPSYSNLISNQHQQYVDVCSQYFLIMHGVLLSCPKMHWQMSQSYQHQTCSLPRWNCWIMTMEKIYFSSTHSSWQYNYDAITCISHLRVLRGFCLFVLFLGKKKKDMLYLPCLLQLLT